MRKVNDDVPCFPSFDSPGGHGPLIDHVQSVRVKDRADQEVKDAVRFVAEKERVANMADKYGSDGVSEMLYWNEAVKHHGPNIAKDIGLHYSTKARPSPEPDEDDRREDDFTSATRSAVKQVSRKQTPEQKAAAMAGIRQLAAEHGDIRIADEFAARHADYLADPGGATLRTGRWIADKINNFVGNQQASNIVKDYEARHKISADERPLMQQALMNGEAMDMPSAHKLARWKLALDEDDPYRRSVISAARMGR
jgi:hypothetical protein